MRTAGDRQVFAPATLGAALLLALACGGDAPQSSAPAEKEAAPAAASAPTAASAPASDHWQGRHAVKASAARQVSGEWSAQRAEPWAAAIPEVVPRFSAGKLRRVEPERPANHGGTGWTMFYSGVSRADYDAYLAALETAGFTLSEHKQGPQATYDRATLFQGEWKIDCFNHYREHGRYSLFIRKKPR